MTLNLLLSHTSHVDDLAPNAHINSAVYGFLYGSIQKAVVLSRSSLKSCSAGVPTGVWKFVRDQFHKKDFAIFNQIFLVSFSLHINELRFHINPTLNKLLLLLAIIIGRLTRISHFCCVGVKVVVFGFSWWLFFRKRIVFFLSSDQTQSNNDEWLTTIIVIITAS